MQINQQDRTVTAAWFGDSEPNLDEPAVMECGPAVIGAYGGNSDAGAEKNEDAAFLMTDVAGEWEFAMVIDAHYSAESAKMLLDLADQHASNVRDILGRQPLEHMFSQLEDHFVRVFTAPDVMARALDLEGEASCLISARCHKFLWWMSIGDCVAYLFHPELARRGQFALNQRNLFEWIGHRNTFTNVVPCYSSGVRELLPGRNVVCLATDGVFEGDRETLIPVEQIYAAYFQNGSATPSGLHEQTHSLLERVHQLRGRDSATIIAWTNHLPG